MSHIDLELRRRPMQERSLRRFAAILDAGRSQLSEVGVDGFTLEHVAATAGVPIGSVYQFFPNKHALIAELSGRDTAAIAEELRQTAARPPTGEWPAGLDRLIDDLADMWRRDPSRRHVWLAMQTTAATRSLAAQQTAQLVDEVVPLLLRRLPDSNGREVRDVAEVVVQMCYSLLHFSVIDDQPRRTTVRELKRALRAYLEVVIAEAQKIE